ncbi:hypothetical protein M9H77_08781 [Catharanthus roseus]|uniref:Uncharacterized protein n=1 Tax=Catharanthus roseus TaxID=4058 RepID=A0ACC0BZ55_CATRO|nr:hypothetical protein M9H77_08781 [Catharanthus roseus]
MSSSLSFHFTNKPLPLFSPLPPPITKSTTTPPSFAILFKHKSPKPFTLKAQKFVSSEPSSKIHNSDAKIPILAIQIGALLATVAEPALAVTGVNDEEDFIWILIQLGISAFFYFLVFPPIIMNWLRIRWYRRSLFEMFIQFMFVFMFFPGLLLWAPFLNFRKFPRDPSIKYPWSTPENPSQIKGGFLKYPWATPEDYD